MFIHKLIAFIIYLQFLIVMIIDIFLVTVWQAGKRAHSLSKDVIFNK